MHQGIKGPFYFSNGIEGKNLSEDMQSHISNMGILSEVSGFKDRIVTALSFEDQEIKEIEEIREKIYRKFLDDFKYIYTNGKAGNTVLFNIPSAHATGFLPMLIEEIHNPESELSKYKVEYVIMDSPSVAGFGTDPEGVKESYEELKQKAENADKYIEIMDYQGVKSDFVEDKELKKKFKKIDEEYLEFKKNLKSRKPHLGLYFPSKQQAELAGMSELEFLKKMYEAGSLDWERITLANEQLAELFREYDNVSIKGENANIEFDISGIGAINSVIQTNYPGAEVYSSPNLDGVNGWITYDNQVRIKNIGETITGLKFRFEKGGLEEIDIIDTKYSEQEKQEIIRKFEEMLGDNENNRRVVEVAFGTNFFVEPGFIHSLIGEKAGGFHFAIGRAYKNPEDMQGKNQKVDNGNGTANFHIDFIRSMNDGSIVTFSKKSGESLEIMNNGIYNRDVLPKLHDYQKEIGEGK